ncbi:hypothetical protein NYF14_16375 [Sphingobium sp. 10 DY56-G10]|uniref:hypothetical protein n=1 Tax=Sphingomonadales TaxID=204457 RepID=UPI0000D7B1D9|nr:hypothetical protein [Sphingomonas sp. SKA58]EAT07010.1 hypothetical protein SKA58_10103 [Sphingomonas sp. SKA58]
MILDVAKLAGSEILSGAPSGRHLYAKLVEMLPDEPSGPEPLFLDFRGVQVATASFLRESVIAFRTFVRSRKSNFYPAVANAVTDVIDDLVEVVQPRGDVLMLCTLGLDGEVIRCRRIGTLDPKQQLTFDLVSRHGETTATQLMEIERSDVKVTAWNNRLSSLSSLGLISEQAQGRTKTYKPIFAGGEGGS